MKYFTLISIISMATATLRDLFLLTEEDEISKLQEFNIVPSSNYHKNEDLLSVLLNCIVNYNSNIENIVFKKDP